MATFTIRPEGIIRQPALTMPGNATGSEAACTALTGSQIRALCGLGTTDNVTFNTVTATTSVLTPLVNNASATLTLGNSTYGVTVPGAMSIGGDVTISKSGNAYLAISQTGVGSSSLRLNGATENAVISNYFGSGDVHVYATNASALASASMLSVKTTGRVGINTNSPSGLFHVAGTNATNVYIDSAGIVNKLLNSAGTFTVQNQSGSNLLSIAESTGAATFSGDISMQKATQGYIRAYSPNGLQPVSIYHDNSHGYITTGNGDLRLQPTSQTVAVTGAVTASGRITTYAGIVSSPTSASNNPATGVCDLLGTNPAIAWSEFGVDNRGVLGFASGSTTLSYRAGGANFTTYPGTEVFTISSTGNVTCAGITASGDIQETYRTSSLDPTISDIGSGKRQGWYNTTATEFRDWVNVGGTLYKSAVYT